MPATLTDLLPGLELMMNPHPLLVHLPIGLLSGFIAAECLSWITGRESLRHAASWMLYFGTLGAAAAVATGLIAAETVEHDETVHRIMETHETYGITVLTLAVLLSVWRVAVRGVLGGLPRALHLALGLLMVGVMTLGADLGGMMVYGHASAVRLPPALPLPAQPPPQSTGTTEVAPPVSPVISPPLQGPSHHHHDHKHPHSH